jgi:hypothetical protein
VANGPKRDRASTPSCNEGHGENGLGKKGECRMNTKSGLLPVVHQIATRSRARNGLGDFQKGEASDAKDVQRRRVSCQKAPRDELDVEMTLRNPNCDKCKESGCGGGADSRNTERPGPR